MWNPLGYLETWEIAAAIAWTLFCAGSLLSARREKQARKNPLPYSVIWLGGFAAAFVLLQIVERLPSTSDGTQPMVKSAPKDDPSKSSNIASARD